MQIPFKISSKSVRLLALAVAALGFGLRLYDLAAESLWYDELLELNIAQGPLMTIFSRLRGHSATPLDYVLVHFWLWAGRSDAWVRLPAVFWGTLALPLAYRLGRTLIRPEVGLLLMLFLALSPFHVAYSQEARPYAMVVVGVLLTVEAFWRLRLTGRCRHLLPLQLGLLISWLAHIFTLAIWGALLLFALIDAGFSRSRRGPMRTLAGLALTALLPLAILIMLGWGDILYYSSKGFGEAVVRPTQAGLEAPRAGGPKLNRTLLLDELAIPLSGTTTGVWLVGLLALAGLGLVYLFSQGRAKTALLLLLWLVLPPVIIVAFLISRGAFFAPRYLISILPAYLLLLALGVLAGPGRLMQKRRNWPAGLLLLAISSVVLVNFWSELTRLYQVKNKEDWRLVAQFIAANAGPADAVIAFHAEPTLNWYWPAALAPPGYFNNLETIQQAVAAAGRGWVILSIFSSGADARLKAWLSEQQAVRLVLDPLIHVYYVGDGAPREQLLAEIQQMALPVDHALYASLARENRRRPEIARRYYELAIEAAPDETSRVEYQTALEALGP